MGGSCYKNECNAGFNVATGDVLFTEEWACDSTLDLNYSGGYGCFYIVDETSGSGVTLSLQAINTFVGATAEIIAEDNGPNNACNSSGTYTKFSAITKAYLFAYDEPNENEHTWQNDSGYDVFLNANSSNNLLGDAIANTSGDFIGLYWIQGS